MPAAVSHRHAARDYAGPGDGVTLRTIWMFYMFADVYLLTTKVDILGVYLYKTAFAFNDLGKAAAISVVLFIIIFAVILLTRKRVNLNGNK